MYAHGGSPAPLPCDLFSRPLCAEVDGVVVVDVSSFVHTADNGMEVRYAAFGFLVQPYAGLATRYVGAWGNNLAVLVSDFLFIKSCCEVVPQSPPVVYRKIFRMLHRRTNLHADDVVLDVGVVHGGELHFRPDTRSVHTLRHEVVTDARYLFGMFLVPRFTRHIEHRPYAVGYRLCVGYHAPSSFASSFVVPAG